MEEKHFKDWAVEQHQNTNHLYDGNLPYSSHLKLVVDQATKFKSIWGGLYPNIPFSIMYNACWGHDLIEDARVSYNDIKKFLREYGYNLIESKKTAEIIFALTNNKGRNRKERANSAYYELIKSTPGAIFVKLCDRIANVKYGELFKSPMFNKYKKEQPEFLRELGLIQLNEYQPMIQYLNELLGL